MNNSINHFLQSSHPSPLLVIRFCRHVQIYLRRLHSEGIWFFILVFIIRFNCLDIFKCNNLCCLFVLTFGSKAIQICLGEDHPPFLPFLEVARLLKKQPLLDFIVAHIYQNLISVHNVRLYKLIYVNSKQLILILFFIHTFLTKSSSNKNIESTDGTIPNSHDFSIFAPYYLLT